MHDGVRVRVEVEREAKSLERVLVDRVGTVARSPGEWSSPSRRGRASESVHVGPRDHEDFVAAQPMESCEDITGKVGAGEMSDVERAVRIRPRRRR